MPKTLTPNSSKWVLRPKHIVHGSNSSYTNWGCRCDKCTIARVESCRKWKRSPNGKLSSRKDHLKRTYGITLEKYNQLYINQNGICKICGKKLPENKLGRFTCIDHNHKTGKIRGLLCIECNSGIGFFKDDITNLERARMYVLENGDI